MSEIKSVYLMMVLVIIPQFVTARFHVERSGHFPVAVDDVGIRFYISVGNNAGYRLVVMKSRQPECCWKVTVGDIDCESMTLFGGFQLEIEKASSKNMTFVFSNIYSIDRVGSCKFYLKELDVNGTLVHEIKFDTTLNEDTSTSMSGGVKIYKRCTGVDQNIRNDCKPYNCAKKYNGFRSFYNKALGKCQALARCTTRLGDDDLPTSAFDFENNRCKTLVPELSESDRKAADEIIDSSPLADERNKYVDVNAEEVAINCKNGHQEGNYCRCSKGWKTVSVATKHGGIKMDWCSKKVPLKKSTAPNRYVKWTIFGILVAVCVFLFALLLYLWWRLFFCEIFQNKPSVVNLSPEQSPRTTRTRRTTRTPQSSPSQRHRQHHTERTKTRGK